MSARPGAHDDCTMGEPPSGARDYPAREQNKLWLGALSVLAALWFVVFPARADLPITAYIDPWRDDAVRNDSFIAVVLQLYPAALALLLAAWFWRAHIAAALDHSARWVALQLCRVRRRVSGPAGDRDDDGRRRNLWWLVAFCVAALLMVLWLISPRQFLPVLIVLGGLLGMVLFGLLGPGWARRLLGGVAVLLAALVALVLAFTQNSPHWLAAVLVITVAVAVVGAALAYLAPDDETDAPRGEDPEHALFVVRSAAWSRAYAPVAAALILQLAALAHMFTTGREIGDGASALMMWSSVMVSFVGSLTFAALRGRSPLHDVSARLLSLYVSWLLLGVAIAGLIWCVAELWEARTVGVDRVSIPSLWVGVGATFAAVVFWLVRARRSERSLTGPSGGGDLLVILALLAVGLGVPLVTLFAEKADRRAFGTPVVMSLTQEGRQIVDRVCGGSPTEVRGWIVDPDVDSSAVRFQFANGYCAEDPEIVVLQDDIAGVRLLGSIGDPALLPAPRPAPDAQGRARIDWFMPDRVPVEPDVVRLSDGPDAPVVLPEMLHWNYDADAPGSVPAEPAGGHVYRVVMQVSDPADPTRCERARYSWTVRATQGPTSPPRVSRDSGCRLDAVLPEGDYTVRARPTGNREGAPALSTTVTVDDVLVLALGDSVGSGEGNPPFRDDESGCNRSNDSSQVRAAQRLDYQDPRRTVTLLHMSCTGGKLALRPRQGQVRGNRLSVQWQIERAEQLLAGRAADVVIISAGANDLGFSSVVEHCIAKNCIEEDIEGGRFDSVDPPDGEPRTIEHLLPGLIARTGPAYRRLPGWLDEVMAERGTILMTEYFDPSRDEDGEFCSRAGVGIVRDEAEYLFNEVVTPLNEMVVAGVETADRTDRSEGHSWSLVGGIAERFATHGYCAEPSDQKWVVGASDSPLRQGELMGSFHPNKPGHGAIALQIHDALTGELALAPR
jgi:hypothetical protein